MTTMKVKAPEKTLGLEPFEQPFFNRFLPFDRFFETSWFNPPRWTEEGERMFFPVFDLCEDEDAYLLVFELPGVTKKDIKITFEKGVLTLSGKREMKKMDGVNWLRVERRFGSFFRTFQMPTDVDFDKVEAFFDNGLLRIKLPKIPAAKPRPIEIK